MYDPEEKLIWEHYLKEADFSHGSFKGDPDVEPMAKMSAHDFDEERPDDLDSDMDLLDMSDAELVHAAHQSGVEDTIVFDGEGDIANNDEVIDAIRGDGAGDELSRIPDSAGARHRMSRRTKGWEEGVHNPDLNPDQMDTTGVRVIQPVNEYGQAIVQGVKTIVANPAVRKKAGEIAAGAAQVGADRAATNVADRLTKKNPEEAQLKSGSDMVKGTIDMGKKAISTATLGLQPTPPNPLEDDDEEVEEASDDSHWYAHEKGAGYPHKKKSSEKKKPGTVKVDHKKEGIKVKPSSSWRDAHENEEDVKESAHRDRGETGISDQELESRRKRQPKEDADRKEHKRKRDAGELSWQKQKVDEGAGKSGWAKNEHGVWVYHRRDGSTMSGHEVHAHNTQAQGTDRPYIPYPPKDKNVEETNNPDLNPDQMDTAGVRIVKQEGCGCAVVPPGEKEDNPKVKVTKIKAKMPGDAMDKIKKLMGF